MKHRNMNLEPVSGKKAREVQVEESTTFRRGGAHLKEIILGFLRKKQVRLVERDFGQRTEHIIANWQALKNAGIPVVPTLRRLKKENSETLVMTDLRHDGSELYGKGLIFHLLVPEHTEDAIREGHKLDSFFMELMNTQFPEIERRAYALAQQAANKGIRLSFDDAFELLIHPNKTWDLICLDLENVDPKSNLPNLAEENIRYTQTFLSALRSVYQIFLERGSTQS